MFEGESSKKNHPLLNNREKRIDIIKCIDLILIISS